jgi:uncharacterized damage-inducible protein DinB
MKKEILNLFEYNRWANQKLVNNIKDQDVNDLNVLKLFSHIVLSEQIWMLRMKGENYSGRNFWEALTLQQCESVMNENKDNYENFIKETDLADIVTYRNSKGIKYTNTVNDILTHVSFHSAYHRGQTAKEIRRLGKEPVLTDYIAFIRQKT